MLVITLGDFRRQLLVSVLAEEFVQESQGRTSNQFFGNHSKRGMQEKRADSSMICRLP